MGAVFVILSALGFSSLGIFGKFAYEAGYTRNQALMWRFGISIPFLFGILAMTKNFGLLREPEVRKKFALALVLGVVGIGLEATLYFATLERVGAALTGIFLYLYPACVALISHFFLRERLSVLKGCCILLSLAGSFLTVDIFTHRAGGSLMDSPMNLVLGVLTALCYSVYLLIGNRVMKGQNPLVISTGIVSGAFLCFLGLTLIDAARSGIPLHMPTNFDDSWPVLGLAWIGSVLPFSTLYAGMKRIGPTKASILSTLEMVFTILFAALFLGESLTRIQLSGAALILISVLLIEAVRSE